ncbi:hypothetical protein TA3x_000421 [Tundrisphaera sp. TA3]|uniref:hypothetical protein n=1 Tax=Tundrisphaera sp. TA3 TaxID=3435775 RepID=UPI003EBA6AAE
MTPTEVRAIRDQLGSTRAMAARLHVTERAVQLQMKRGIKRRSTAEQVRALLETPR